MSDSGLGKLRWSWFQAFIALSRCGSQSAASRHLGCSQPTVGTSVKKLETWVGARLGNGHSPYELTETGKELLALIKKTSRNLERHRINTGSSLRDFKLEWITLFYVMRKYRSQYKSMELTGLIQSDISRKILLLERWLGQSLFKKCGGWHTTEFGESFLYSSDKILMRFVEFKRNVSRRIEENDNIIEQEVRDYNEWMIDKFLKKLAQHTLKKAIG